MYTYLYWYYIRNRYLFCGLYRDIYRGRSAACGRGVVGGNTNLEFRVFRHRPPACHILICTLQIHSNKNVPPKVSFHSLHIE